jgi:hypothetical protein
LEEKKLRKSNLSIIRKAKRELEYDEKFSRITAKHAMEHSARMEYLKDLHHARELGYTDYHDKLRDDKFKRRQAKIELRQLDEDIDFEIMVLDSLSGSKDLEEPDYPPPQSMESLPLESLPMEYYKGYYDGYYDGYYERDYEVEKILEVDDEARPALTVMDVKSILLGVGFSVLIWIVFKGCSTLL